MKYVKPWLIGFAALAVGGGLIWLILIAPQLDLEAPHWLDTLGTYIGYVSIGLVLIIIAVMFPYMIGTAMVEEWKNLDENTEGDNA